ncbi:unnamed protein product [Brassicogethes aeneus]|uniref:Sugar transporter SWEET n=1 Tax=Brassicogethes aeneus TaxID=1431903 RepID=A0A9P0FJG4_BRAAE|nr:unnamed protein product [Brassicogethes aeneus]
MERLSASLQPHKELVGSIASIVTILQFFTGAFLIKDIYKKQSTEGIPAIPFIGGIVIGSLTLKYAQILNDPAMLQVNVFAIILNSIYLMVYFAYSKDRVKEVWQPVSVGVAIAAVFLGYAAVESPANLEFRYGLAVTVLMLLLVASPLMDVAEIISNKDASSIPFPMTLMGSLVSFLWLIYGIILLNNFMIVQNIIGFLLCMVQLVLIQLYPGKPKNKKISKSKNKSQ